MKKAINVISTDIVRRIDKSGCIQIPKSIRDEIGLVNGDFMEFFNAPDGVYIKICKQKNDVLTPGEIAKDFLNAQQNTISHHCTRFYMCGDTTKCQAVVNGKLRQGIAVKNAKDKYDPCIGMAIAFCRAMCWTIPFGLI